MEGEVHSMTVKRDDILDLYKEIVGYYIAQVRFLLELPIIREVHEDLTVTDLPGSPLVKVLIIEMWACPTNRVSPYEESKWKRLLEKYSHDLVETVKLLNLDDRRTCLNLALFLEKFIREGWEHHKNSSGNAIKRVMRDETIIAEFKKMKFIHEHLLKLFKCRDRAGLVSKVGVVEPMRSDLYEASRLCFYNFDVTGDAQARKGIVNLTNVHRALRKFPVPQLRSHEVEIIMESLLKRVNGSAYLDEVMDNITVVQPSIVRRPLYSHEFSLLRFFGSALKLQHVVELNFNRIFTGNYLPKNMKYKYIAMEGSSPYPAEADLVHTVVEIEDLKKQDGIVLIAYHPKLAVAVALLSACFKYSRGGSSLVETVRSEGVYDSHPQIHAPEFRDKVIGFQRAYDKHCDKI